MNFRHRFGIQPLAHMIPLRMVPTTREETTTFPLNPRPHPTGARCPWSGNRRCFLACAAQADPPPFPRIFSPSCSAARPGCGRTGLGPRKARRSARSSRRHRNIWEMLFDRGSAQVRLALGKNCEELKKWGSGSTIGIVGAEQTQLEKMGAAENKIAKGGRAVVPALQPPQRGRPAAAAATLCSQV